MNPEAIEAAARAMAILDDHDGCFLVVDQWEGQEDWEREAHPDNYPGMAYEDCKYWRGKARAALEAAAPYLLAAAWDEGFKRGTLDQFEDSENPYRKPSA